KWVVPRQARSASDGLNPSLALRACREANDSPHKLLNNAGLAILEAHRHEQFGLAAALAYPRRGGGIDFHRPLAVDAINALFLGGFDLIGDGGAEPKIVYRLFGRQRQRAADRRVRLAGHAIGKILNANVAAGI